MNNDTKEQMLQELNELLNKYNVDLCFTCSECSDTYGLSDDRLVIIDRKTHKIIHDFDGWVV